MRGPRTPFSLERERTFVTPPEVNPERQAQLDGAMEDCRGATFIIAQHIRPPFHTIFAVVPLCLTHFYVDRRYILKILAGNKKCMHRV